MSENVDITKTDGVLSLLLNRPDKKNAITDAMYKSLAIALEDADQDSQVRVILIRGAGDMFSAGNDVAEFAAAAENGSGLGNVMRFLHALSSSSKPLVAAVQGRAVGIGTTLLMHCDYVVLSENAQLTTPFVNLALVPEAASSLLLPYRVGHVRAFAMFALGRPLEAQTALNLGIANEVVPNADLVASAEAIAQQLAKQPLGSLIATKKLMRPADAIVARIQLENKAFEERMKSAEAREAFSAFTERRPPDFSKFA